MSLFSWILFGVVLVLFFGILSRNLIKNYKEMPVYRCPQCDSTDVIEVDHQTKGSNTVVQGNQIGADVRLQLVLKLFMRCKNCGHGFETEARRTY